MNLIIKEESRRQVFSFINESDFLFWRHILNLKAKNISKMASLQQQQQEGTAEGMSRLQPATAATGNNGRR